MRPSERNRLGAGWATGLGFGLLVTISACTSETDGLGGGGGGGACVPNAVSTCGCADGSMATATCDPSGTVIGPCSCATGVVPAGSGAPSTTTPAAPVTGAPTTTPPPTTTTTPPVITPPPTTTTPPPTTTPPAAGSGAMEPVMDPPVATGDAVPAGEHCASVATWDPAWTMFEEEVLRLTNEWRAKGANCDTMGMFGPADPLTMNAMLRCSSRLHSKDMGENDFFEHTNLAGDDPFDRMAAAGYMGFTMGENIAMGQQTPKEVVDGWIESDGHCSNIMNPDFTEIGVGYWEGEADNQFFNGNKLWTQNFGAPGGGGGWPRGG